MIINEKPEVFREHFDECFKHFVKKFNASIVPGKKGVAKARKPIADFCGVGDQTVAMWFSDPEKFLPAGEVEIKMKCFLDLNGYRIIEFERLPKVQRNFAELIGYGVISARQAGEFVGYSKFQTLYPVLKGLEGYDGVSKEKEARMYELWKSRKDLLEQKKQEDSRLYRLEFLTQPAIQQALLPATPTDRTISIVQRPASFHIMEGLLELLEEGALDEFSAMDLEAVRARYGQTILRLSARLSALSARLIGAGKGD